MTKLEFFVIIMIFVFSQLIVHLKTNTSLYPAFCLRPLHLQHGLNRFLLWNPQKTLLVEQQVGLMHQVSAQESDQPRPQSQTVGRRMAVINQLLCIIIIIIIFTTHSLMVECRQVILKICTCVSQGKRIFLIPARVTLGGRLSYFFICYWKSWNEQKPIGITLNINHFTILCKRPFFPKNEALILNSESY